MSGNSTHPPSVRGLKSGRSPPHIRAGSVSRRPAPAGPAAKLPESVRKAMPGRKPGTARSCRALRSPGLSRAERGACGADDLRQPRQLPRCAIRVEARIQTIRHLLQFQFQRHPVQHHQIFISQLVHLRVQERAQFLWIGGQRGERTHAAEPATRASRAQDRHRAAFRHEVRRPHGARAVIFPSLGKHPEGRWILEGRDGACPSRARRRGGAGQELGRPRPVFLRLGTRASLLLANLCPRCRLCAPPL